MRDPKIDPAVGDVLAKGKETRIVTEVTIRKDGVPYRLVTKCTATDRIYPWIGYPLMAQWRAWAKTARVQEAPDA